VSERRLEPVRRPHFPAASERLEPVVAALNRYCFSRWVRERFAVVAVTALVEAVFRLAAVSLRPVEWRV
jgi:hypothetical protein